MVIDLRGPEPKIRAESAEVVSIETKARKSCKKT